MKNFEDYLNEKDNFSKEYEKDKKEQSSTEEEKRKVSTITLPESEIKMVYFEDGSSQFIGTGKGDRPKFMIDLSKKDTESLANYIRKISQASQK